MKIISALGLVLAVCINAHCSEITPSNDGLLRSIKTNMGTRYYLGNQRIASPTMPKKAILKKKRSFSRTQINVYYGPAQSSLNYVNYLIRNSKK